MYCRVAGLLLSFCVRSPAVVVLTLVSIEFTSILYSLSSEVGD